MITHFDSTPWSLYIHWPFCPYRCHFCPFIAYAGRDPLMPRYHAALMKELETFAASVGRIPIQTIFLGGGTPSTWPDELLLDMGGTIERLFDQFPGREMTIEVNPGTVRREQFPLWRASGINRLSIGVQSVNEKVLQNLNRHQSTQQVTDLLNDASRHFDNLSIDLIIGLPGVSDEQWRSMIEALGNWPIRHISIYFLTVHEGTALYYRVQQNDLFLPADDGVVDLYLWTVDKLAQHGFEQYEVSNFAREGAQCRHNKAYWQRTPYRGIGVGAWSFDGKHRFANVRTIEEYLERMESDQNPQGSQEELSEAQVWMETIMLALRQRSGIAHETLFSRAEPARTVAIQALLKQLITTGRLRNIDDRYVLTPAGLAMANEIVVRMVDVTSRPLTDITTH
jgi:oxygen-independent coproporphyrinogen III oxidase